MLWFNSFTFYWSHESWEDGVVFHWFMWKSWKERPFTIYVVFATCLCDFHQSSTTIFIGCRKKRLWISIYLYLAISSLQAFKAPEHEHGKRCASCKILCIAWKFPNVFLTYNFNALAMVKSISLSIFRNLDGSS